MPNKVLAKEGAISCGINLDFECAWIGPPDHDRFTPFGPDAMKDNIFQNFVKATHRQYQRSTTQDTRQT